MAASWAMPFVALASGAGPLSHASTAQERVELDTLSEVATFVLAGDSREEAMNRDIFEDLFVLEIANNHWGSVDRGLKIITAFSRVVRFNNVRAAMKLQFRDVDRFVHRDFRDRTDIRYIKKTIDTRMSAEDYGTLVEATRKAGCVTMASPFDEASVDLCQELGVQIIKIASSDLNDWMLIEKIATARKPVIVSTGGSSLKDIDDLVTFFENRNIPLAINHCVSLYPSENCGPPAQPDRLPDAAVSAITRSGSRPTSTRIGPGRSPSRTRRVRGPLSATSTSRMGACTVSPYCSLPEQIDTWFKAWKDAKEMCGAPGEAWKVSTRAEIEYLDALVRGVYAARDLPAGQALRDEDVYLAIPLQKGQISCRELMRGEVRDAARCAAHEPIRIEDIDSPYANNDELKQRHPGTRALTTDAGQARSREALLAELRDHARRRHPADARAARGKVAPGSWHRGRTCRSCCSAPATSAAARASLSARPMGARSRRSSTTTATAGARRSMAFRCCRPRRDRAGLQATASQS